MSRPSKLTPETQQVFVGAIRAGCHFYVAADLAKVARSTAHDWLNRTGPQYRTFQAEVRQAEAHHAAILSASATRGAERNPVVALRMLQMRHRREWADNATAPSVAELLDDIARRLADLEANAERDRTTIYLTADQVKLLVGDILDRNRFARLKSLRESGPFGGFVDESDELMESEDLAEPDD